MLKNRLQQRRFFSFSTKTAPRQKCFQKKSIPQIYIQWILCSKIPIFAFIFDWFFNNFCRNT